jgi:hypothetical protein
VIRVSEQRTGTTLRGRLSRARLDEIAAYTYGIRLPTPPRVVVWPGRITPELTRRLLARKRLT